MPFPLIPLIGAGASILGNVLTGANQARQNRLAREYADSRYNIERRDNLSDWAMQNDYNSPLSQMQRLRAAGLNPNLVYGQGAVANSTAPVKGADSQSWRPEATKVDLSGVGNSLMSYYNVKMQEAQIDNLKAANTVQIQDALLKAAQTASTIQSTDTSKFNLAMAEQLKSTSIEKAQMEVNKLKTDVDVTLNQDERAAAQNAVSLQKAAEEILTLRLGRSKTQDERRAIQQQIESVRRDVKLKDLDIELKRLGIQPGDPMWTRALGRIIGDPGKVKLDLKRDSIPDRRLDSLKIPYKSGYQNYLDDRKMNR